jgi:hypothetical protein
MMYQFDGETAGAYGTYSGDVSVSYNFMEMSFFENGQLDILIQGFQGDPACTNTSMLDYATYPNACGIHVHANADCDDAGGHFWFNQSLVDPWKFISYDNMTEFDVSIADYGYNWSNTQGQALVFHDSEGARVACTLIEPREDPMLDQDQDWQLSDAQVYFNYEGTAMVQDSSVISVGMVDGTNWAYISHTMEVTNLNGGCQGTVCSGANCCGIHIHSGHSCDEDALGHFYENDVDPWVNVRYTNSPGQVQTQYIDVGTMDISNRTFIIHDEAGARIACYLLSVETPTSPSSASLFGASSVFFVSLLF